MDPGPTTKLHCLIISQPPDFHSQAVQWVAWGYTRNDAAGTDWLVLIVYLTRPCGASNYLSEYYIYIRHWYLPNPAYVPTGHKQCLINPEIAQAYRHDDKAETKLVTSGGMRSTSRPDHQSCLIKYINPPPSLSPPVAAASPLVPRFLYW